MNLILVQGQVDTVHTIEVIHMIQGMLHLVSVCDSTLPCLFLAAYCIRFLAHGPQKNLSWY